MGRSAHSYPLPVPGSGPGPWPWPALSLSFQGGGTLSSLWSLNIGPFTQRQEHTPLSESSPHLLTPLHQTHVNSLLVILGPRLSQTDAKGNSGHHHILGILSRFFYQTLKISWASCDPFPLPSHPASDLLQPPSFPQLSPLKSSRQLLAKGNSLFVLQLHLPSAHNGSYKSFLFVSKFLC